MMTYSEMLKVLDRVTFQSEEGLKVVLVPDGPGMYYLQLVDDALPPEFNTGRKWRISPHMTKSEIVGTAFKAYLTWVEHEARESFQYRGQSIFGPHFDVDTMVNLAAERENYEYRD